MRFVPLNDQLFRRQCVLPFAYSIVCISGRYGSLDAKRNRSNCLASCDLVTKSFMIPKHPTPAAGTAGSCFRFAPSPFPFSKSIGSPLQAQPRHILSGTEAGTLVSVAENATLPLYCGDDRSTLR